MEQLADIGAEAARRGWSLEATRTTDRLTADAGFTPLRLCRISLGLDRPFVLQRAWQEATGAFDRSDPPRGHE